MRDFLLVSYKMIRVDYNHFGLSLWFKSKPKRYFFRCTQISKIECAMKLIIYLSSLLYRTVVELLLVELLSGAKFVYKSIMPVCIEFVLDPECNSSDSRRITSSSRKPVVATLI